MTRPSIYVFKSLLFEYGYGIIEKLFTITHLKQFFLVIMHVEYFTSGIQNSPLMYLNMLQVTINGDYSQFIGIIRMQMLGDKE